MLWSRSTCIPKWRWRFGPAKPKTLTGDDALVQLRLCPSSAADIGSARAQVPYTANLTLQLPSGTNLTVPVKGTYRGSSYSPVVRPCHPAAALVSAPGSV